MRLTKHYTMKTYPMRNEALSNEDVVGSGGIAARILDLCTRWRWVVSFTPWLLYPQALASDTH